MHLSLPVYSVRLTNDYRIMRILNDEKINRHGEKLMLMWKWTLLAVDLRNREGTKYS
jgi:hypothetical protein